jgi:hypothetical protein
MTSPARGRRGTKIVLFVLGALLAVVAGTALWIKLSADHRWAAAEARIRELPARVPGGGPRPSTETAKRIQEDFVGAHQEAVRQKQELGAVDGLKHAHKPGAAADKVLGDAAGFLDRIHDASRRSIAAPSEFPPGWQGEWDQSTIELVSGALVLRSRRRRELGQSSEAAVALLDALPLVRFWSESGSLSNH